MNTGMPNTSALTAKGIASMVGATGILGAVLEAVLKVFLDNSSKKVLMVADDAHVGFIVPREGSDWEKSEDGAYAIVDLGMPLTQEQKDAIDKPPMDAFIKLASFRVRKPGSNP